MEGNMQRSKRKRNMQRAKRKRNMQKAKRKRNMQKAKRNMQRAKSEEEEEYAKSKEEEEYAKIGGVFKEKRGCDLEGTSWQVLSIIFLLLIPNVASVVPLSPLQQITM